MCLLCTLLMPVVTTFWLSQVTCCPSHDHTRCSHWDIIDLPAIVVRCSQVQFFLGLPQCEGNPVGFATLRHINHILCPLQMQICPRMDLERTITDAISSLLIQRPLLPFPSSYSCVHTMWFTSVCTSVPCRAGSLCAHLFLALLHQLLRSSGFGHVGLSRLNYIVSS
jgi:hypothetical protein